MKRFYVTLCATMVGLSAMLSSAAGYKSVMIDRTDGSKMEVTIESGMTTVFADGNMTMSCAKGEIVLPMSDVDFWTFSTAAGDNDLWAGIELPAVDGISITKDSERVLLSNLPAGSVVMLVNIDGRVINRCTAGGDYELSLGSLTPGLYILTYNNQSIKIAVAR